MSQLDIFHNKTQFAVSAQINLSDYEVEGDLSWMRSIGREQKVILSVSGGETSMMKAALVKRWFLGSDDVVCIFANTGLENEETLEFIDKCDKAFDLNIIWIEAVTNPEHGKGVTHRVTDFERAFRSNEYKHPDHPFHAHIRKNGIPNLTRPQCSDRLKEFAIEHYKKVNNLKGYPHLLGMRHDEPLRTMPKDVREILDQVDITPTTFRRMEHQHRVNAFTSSGFDCVNDEETYQRALKRVTSYSKKLNKYNLTYALTDAWNIDKQDVNSFWESQSFRLELQEHQGNCQTCWKKSDTKLLLLAKENPAQFAPFQWFEKQYGHVKQQDIGSVFFRKNKSAEMILGEAGMYDKFMLQQLSRRADNDIDFGGCGSSCESYSMVS